MTTQAQRKREDGKVQCPECGNLYSGLGQHWRQSGCEYPTFNDEQHEIIKGRMLGDVSINTTGSKNPNFEFIGISWPYLEWLDQTFGCLTTGVNIKETSEEKNKTGYGEEYDCCDYYRVCTRSMPCIEEYNEWYELDDDNDRYLPFPESVDLTPTIFKHWFVSDWSIIRRRNTQRPHIQFNSNKAIGNIDALHSYFDHLPVELVDGNIYENSESGIDTQQFRFSVEDSEWLWGWMGDSVPGYEYKWPNGPTYEEWKKMIRTTTDRYGTPPRYQDETVVKETVTKTEKTVEKTVEREIIATDGGELTQSSFDEF